MDLYDLVRRRRMVRNYSSEPVSDEVIDRIVSAGTRGPSAGFSQGQSFVVVRDAELRASVAAIAREEEYARRGFHRWIGAAPVLIVCCTSEKIYRDRYREPDKLGPDGEPIEWPIPYWWVDAGCALMLVLLAASHEGLASGFLGLDEDGYRELKVVLEIPEHVTPIGIVTVGHPAPDRRSGSLRRGWKPLDQVVHIDRWNGE